MTFKRRYPEMRGITEETKAVQLLQFQRSVETMNVEIMRGVDVPKAGIVIQEWQELSLFCSFSFKQKVWVITIGWRLQKDCKNVWKENMSTAKRRLLRNLLLCLVTFKRCLKICLNGQGQGCGSVGRAVASCTRGLRFKSSQWQNVIMNLFPVNCWKEAINGAFKNTFHNAGIN